MLPRPHTHRAASPEAFHDAMKFGKQLHYERVASGPLADALPWIDYGCVPASDREGIGLYSFSKSQGTRWSEVGSPSN
jgi:hypothetical protein|tara:strand:- start:3313 stop:3546 length:234 start_codon:yes stop_codon:yes gene_type:complete